VQREEDCFGSLLDHSFAYYILGKMVKTGTRKLITIFAIADLLFMGSLGIIPTAQADGSTPEKVPSPQVHEDHVYNVPQRDEHGNIGTGPFCKEGWGIVIHHGGLKIGFSASKSVDADVSYGQVIQYSIGGKTYMAMFMLSYGKAIQMELVIGNWTQTIDVINLNTCDGFKLTNSSVKYDGTMPTLDCNITFERIHVYQNEHEDSTFNLTFLHHFRGGWNQTSIKVEVLFDFSNTKFYQSNGTELDAGEHFTAKISYLMKLTDAKGNTIMPTGCTNTTLEYNMRLDNGLPLTVSKLEMKDSFTIYNGTGSSASIGYSAMNTEHAEYGTAVITHGFPNLTYKNTQSIKSDPEITVYHDRVGVTGNTNLALIAATGATVAVAATGAVVFMRKRKKK
jgi:hypothetical protein